MHFYRIITPGLAINTYLVADPTSREGVVIDPVRNINPVLSIAAKEKITIKAIVETHVHADFISGAKELKHFLKGSPIIYCSGMGGEKWVPRYADVVIKDRQEIKLGSLSLQAIHTPGHTPEHLMWLVWEETPDFKDPFMVMSGDFLLVGTLGRPDILGSDLEGQLSEQLYESAFNVLPQLPNHTQVFPAHGAGSFCAKAIGTASSTSMEQERLNNPLLRPTEKTKWKEALFKNMPPVPTYFSRLKKINTEGPPLIQELPEPTEINMGQMLSLGENVTIVDTRDPEEYAAMHLKNSINIPAGPLFIKWAPEILQPGPMALIVKDREQLISILNSLYLVGLDQVISYAFTTERAFDLINNLVETFPVISAVFAAQSHQEKPAEYQVLDVRTDEEWQKGHIKNAIHIPLHQFQDALEKIPPGKTIDVICGGGHRSSIAASLLRKKGFTQVRNIGEGMHGWKKTKLPVVQDPVSQSQD